MCGIAEMGVFGAAVGQVNAGLGTTMAQAQALQSQLDAIRALQSRGAQDQSYANHLRGLQQAAMFTAFASPGFSRCEYCDSKVRGDKCESCGAPI